MNPAPVSQAGDSTEANHSNVDQHADHTDDLSEPATAGVPPKLLGLAQLMGRMFSGEDLSSVGQSLLQRAELGEANALLDLSVFLQLRGDEATGVAVQEQALAIQRHFTLNPKLSKSPLKLLAIMAPGNLMTNTPLEFLAEGAGFDLELLYLTADGMLPDALPEHDVAIVALSELERNRLFLQTLAPAADHWPRPLLNHPSSVESLPRDEVSLRLQNYAHIEMPITAAVQRSDLNALVAGGLALDGLLSDAQWPLIIRPIDSHAGQGLERLFDASELNTYLKQYDDDAFYVARYVDYRSEDGQFRKYRIMLIDGEPYLAHMAISDHWMIHYLNAGMVESETKRNEEAETMINFSENFAQRHKAALADIHRVSGLDYLGIDCGETLDGRLVVFEIGASMNVHAMDPVDIFPYKQPQMERIFTAFESMLLHKHLNYRIDRRRSTAPASNPKSQPPQKAALGSES